MSNDSANQGSFLDVFVIRSFRESHLDEVVAKITEFVKSYPSPYWGGITLTKPFRIVDINQQLISGHWLRDEIYRHIDNAAICIVILDGMRPNIFFELGYMQARGRPYVLLRHHRYGPSFTEIDSDVSDLKGQVVKEYDHENQESFHKLLESEIGRCDTAFVQSLGTHLLIPHDSERTNLIDKRDKARWKPREPKKKAKHAWQEEGLEIKSGALEYELNRHISRGSLLIVGAKLLDKCSTLTVYIELHFRKAEKEVPVWFGYSSRTVAPYGDHREKQFVEITIPLSVSGPSKFELVDNIWNMVSDRLGAECVGPLRISRICLWVENGSILFSEIRIT